MYKAEYELVESAFPNWEQTVRTVEFRCWLVTQTRRIRALAASEISEDAIALLTLYKCFVDKNV